MSDILAVSAPVIDFSSALVQLLHRKNPDAPADLFGLAGELAKASERGDVCVAIPAATNLAAWLDSGLVGEAGSFTPLIASQQRLYLARYHQYESRLAEQLLALAADQVAVPDEAEIKMQLAALFATSKENPDWQQVAVAAALHQRLTVISGGPGTGKTTTLVKLLALLQMTATAPLQIGLAAPTGKAAMRMQEAIGKGKAELLANGVLSSDVAACIPDTAVTLHRLLGSRFNSVQFKHTATQPLVLDVLVLDEASMIDLALMSKLVDALPPHGRLILLGDKDQLSSVEAGAVMGDVCAGAGLSPQFAAQLSRITGQNITAGFSESRLGDHVMTLHKSYRFSGVIGELARAINRGELRKLSELLASSSPAESTPLTWYNGNPAQQDLIAPIMQGFDAYFAALARKADANETFKAFDAFRVLSPIRNGAASVSRVNAVIEAQLVKRGWRSSDQVWYTGRPVLVPQNLYDLELYNGDIGLTLPDETGKLWVYFPAAEGGTRAIAPARLPAVETAFAMTVHKSQGSEFGHVLLLLPSPADGAGSLLSRELVYTAITRARNKVSLWGEESVIASASRKGVVRQSGLAQRLQLG
ncbi:MULTISPECIES: exodeoxyribonuclease V subunit alpha [Deefgea]|uniref:RecBCD enzyme subunit RecD n=1 Tax=Deefgea chitinilytica TaxID=570276 RepID=A0ABS2C8L8_9NEIS|nr:MULTISPECIES: exodeoxyribonuclease V subunit alpha [Deefgea]MBM5570402.1 exodeoxyribonuclease V subunit alpha [Deefgea chitinilytica]MBM9887631.1 exodeoxyribonuclease V subunit alpha [Deefgea sp. CFH1-16]